MNNVIHILLLRGIQRTGDLIQQQNLRQKL